MINEESLTPGHNLIAIIPPGSSLIFIPVHTRTTLVKKAIMKAEYSSILKIEPTCKANIGKLKIECHPAKFGNVWFALKITKLIICNLLIKQLFALYLFIWQSPTLTSSGVFHHYRVKKTQ